MTTATRETTSIAAPASPISRARTSARGSSMTETSVRARADVVCSDVWRSAPTPTASPRPSTESGSIVPSFSREISTLPSRMTKRARRGAP